jgi:ribose transport system permease protein
MLLQKISGSNYLVGIVLMLMLIGAQIIIPGFLGIRNVGNILKIASFIGIAAIGQTLAILIGGIDMSISNVVTLVNIMTAQMMVGDNSNIPVTLITILCIGAVVGTVNAFGITYFKIPPIVMTIGMGTVIQGIALLYSKGAPKGNAAPLLRYLVNEPKIFGFTTWVVIFWVVLAIMMIVLLKMTPFGRRVFAIGNNRTTARFSGIKINRIIFTCYILSGIFAAVTGVILTGYTGTASAQAGAQYSMNSIVAVVVGGTAITGGRGGYGGTIVGVIILTILNNILTVMNIPISGVMIAQGLIIIVMVYVYGKEKAKTW